VTVLIRPSLPVAGTGAVRARAMLAHLRRPYGRGVQSRPAG